MHIATPQDKLNWIQERIAEGRTVYLSTTTRHTLIRAKHLPLVRATDKALEVCNSGTWINHNYSKLSAQ